MRITKLGFCLVLFLIVGHNFNCVISEEIAEEKEYLPRLTVGQTALVVEDLDGDVISLRQDDQRIFVDFYLITGVDVSISHRIDSSPKELLSLLTREYRGISKSGSEVLLVPSLQRDGCLVYRVNRTENSYEYIQLKDPEEIKVVIEEMGTFIARVVPHIGIDHYGKHSG